MRRLLPAALAALMLNAAAHAAPTEEGDHVNSYILLDRTRSMSSIWDEALGSVNAYAASVAENEDDGPDTLETRITLAVFDAQDGLEFDVLRRNANADTWTAVTHDEASPRGMTPLFDAIGEIVSLAEKDAPDKAVLVIMTDGHENASRELDRKAARAALDRARGRGWEVVFLGAEFADFDDADSVGVSGAQSMAIGKGQFSESMQRLGKKSRTYGKGESEGVVFDDEDRAIAQEDEVKARQGQ